MSKPDIDLMYVYIPKNASSWTKPNLLDHGWEFYNYHTDNLDKPALVVLRDPVDRWLSGIAEYMALYQSNFRLLFQETEDLVFDRIVFDDHTERQVKFLHGLDTERCTFMMCDENYRNNFSEFIAEHYGVNKYARYEYQHVSEEDETRRRFKTLFRRILEREPKYVRRLTDYYEDDYRLIEQVQFYGTR
jgi:hypothetical protein